MVQQQMRIETMVDGVTKAVNTPYTVESKMTLDQEALKTLAMELLNQRGFDSRYNNDSGRKYMQSYMMSLFGYMQPLFTGGVVLSNEPSIEPEADKKIGWGVAIDKSLDARYVAGADIMVPYSGSDQYRGTINRAESYWDEGAKKTHAHLVFDFPTHAANKEFNTVTFTPKPIYERPLDSALGFVSNGVAGCMDSYYNSKYHQAVTKSPVLRDYFNSFKLSDTYTEYMVANGCVLGSCSKKMFYSNPETGLKQAIFDKEEYNTLLSSSTQASGNFVPAYLNGKWYVFFNGYGILTERGLPLKFVEITKVQVGGDGSYVLTTGAEKSITIPSDFLNNTSSSNKAYFRLIKAVQQGNKIALVMAGHSSGGTYSNNLGVIFTDSSFTVEKYSTSYMNLGSGSAIYSYTLTAIPSSAHSFGDDVVLLGSTRDATQLMKLDTTTNTVTTISKYASDSPFYKLAKTTGYTTSSYLTPQVDMANTNIIYALTTGGRLGDGTNFYYLSEVDIQDWLIKFKLESPMQKTADETLKLTFDITIEI